jgi:hypothetical protein
MADKTKYQATGAETADWRTGSQSKDMMARDFYNKQEKGKHTGLLDYYMPRFYSEARGHVVNKYHVGFYGPYVDQALMVMDQNSYADKYNLNRTKPFYDTKDNFRKSLFDQWMELCYDKSSGVLNMYWAAKQITIPSPTAAVKQVMIDSTKQIMYPVVTGVNCENTLTIEVVDDPYMMWYNFFNALFNVQYSPLLLKPKSTLQKINIMVNLYTEGLTWGNSQKSIHERTGGNACMTDLVVGQMFEFNSCVTTKAPNLTANYESAAPYTFSVDFKYPNAYQGTFKDQMRYLRDNTTRGVDPAKVKERKWTDCPYTMVDTRCNPYGEYNKGFFEVDHDTWQERYNTALYDAFQPNVYKRYIATKNSYFKKVEYKYDMHGVRQS